MNNYSTIDKELARAAVILSSPARIQILSMLSVDKEVIFNHIKDKLPLVKSTVWQHMNLMRDAKVINLRNEGKTVYCSINSEVWDRYYAGFLDLFGRHSN